jgi:hypothetical protein
MTVYRYVYSDVSQLSAFRPPSQVLVLAPALVSVQEARLRYNASQLEVSRLSGRRALAYVAVSPPTGTLSQSSPVLYAAPFVVRAAYVHESEEVGDDP